MRRVEGKGTGSIDFDMSWRRSRKSTSVERGPTSQVRMPKLLRLFVCLPFVSVISCPNITYVIDEAWIA